MLYSFLPFSCDLLLFRKMRTNIALVVMVTVVLLLLLLLLVLILVVASEMEKGT